MRKKKNLKQLDGSIQKDTEANRENKGDRKQTGAADGSNKKVEQKKEKKKPVYKSDGRSEEEPKRETKTSKPVKSHRASEPIRSKGKENNKEVETASPALSVDTNQSKKQKESNEEVKSPSKLTKEQLQKTSYVKRKRQSLSSEDDAQPLKKKNRSVPQESQDLGLLSQFDNNQAKTTIQEKVNSTDKEKEKEKDKYKEKELEKGKEIDKEKERGEKEKSKQKTNDKKEESKTKPTSSSTSTPSSTISSDETSSSSSSVSTPPKSAIVNTGLRSRTKQRSYPERLRWTVEEERNLEQGITLFGVGNWAQILESFKFNKKRNAVSLKDKWRNLARRRNTFTSPKAKSKSVSPLKKDNKK